MSAFAVGADSLSNQPLYWPPLRENIIQRDSTFIFDSLAVNQANSLKSDLIRSAVGTAVGGFVGAAIGGVIPILFGRDYDDGTFPDNSFYLSSYLGAGFLGGLSSAGALYLSKNRDVSYWKLAGYSLLPPMISVLPLSVYASANDKDELVRSTWIAMMASLGITAMWNVFVYRIHPLRESDGYRMRFGSVYPYHDHTELSMDNSIGIRIAIVEIRF